MITKYYWHEQNRLVAVMQDRDLHAYLHSHPSLPTETWIEILPGPKPALPLYRVQAPLIDAGAEIVMVFRSDKWPVEVLKWSGGLILLIATMKDCLARHQAVARHA